MNRDAEAIDQFLAWLTQSLDQTILSSGNFSNPFADLELSESVDLLTDRDPLDSEVEAMQAALPEFDIYVEDVSSLELGEIPAVQDRFHAIIKRRLRAEIERNPPLFPWETTLLDYEDQPATSRWNPQLQALKLPVAVPESLMLQIFAECRKLADSSLKQGVKLVRAVESLFPEDLASLNYWAGQVLMEPARSSATLSAADLPASYEQANAAQQMVLSLLAAQQVLQAMTLELSPDHPQAESCWLTAAGELTICADYLSAGRLRVQAQMPMSGRLTLNGESNQATAVCTDAETLTVELGLLPGQTYRLQVSLNNSDSLTFVIVLSDD